MDKTTNTKQKPCILITGANDGIGKATAIGLAQTKARVIVHARNSQSAQKTMHEIVQKTGNKNIHLEICDLASMEQVRNLAYRIMRNFPDINVLVNNAGVFLNERIVTEDGFEATFAINHLSHFLLTNMLLDVLIQNGPSRIVNVSSMTHDSSPINKENIMLESDYTGYKAYSQSKLANILFTYALHRRLQDQGHRNVCVNALHPGVINTKLLEAGWGLMGDPSLDHGAQLSIYLAADSRVEGISGKYFSEMSEKKSASVSYAQDVQETLWQLSNDLLGTSFV